MTGIAHLQAVQHIRKMRGGAQAHLLRGSDGGFWVTKFQNNPQHVRVLANEFLASRIGCCLGLPMSQVTPIEVPDWLIENTPELRIESAGFTQPCASGLQLASRYVADPATDAVFDYLPESKAQEIMNLEDFPRCLVCDKWTGNADGRQAVFSRSPHYLGYKTWFIDQGHCFNAGQWTFPDLALHGVYYRNYVYQQVTGWESFEPTLTSAEQADLDDLWEVAEGLPEAWWNRDTVPEGMPKQWWNEKFPSELTRLIETLYKRRSSIRDLITNFREQSRNPFPNWKDKPMVAVPAMPNRSCRIRGAPLVAALAPPVSGLTRTCVCPQTIFSRGAPRPPSQTLPARRPSLLLPTVNFGAATAIGFDKLCSPKVRHPSGWRASRASRRMSCCSRQPHS